MVFEDNFGFLSKVFYDKHKLFIRRSIDAVKNETAVEGFNYRTLSPYLMRDANDNRAGAKMDEIGLVVATFIMGKEGEFKGDLMDTGSKEISSKDHPTTKLEYEFRYFISNGKLPNRVKTSVREKHHYKPKLPEAGNIVNWMKTLTNAVNTTDPGPATGIIWQDSYSYSDGSGHEILRKVQAEPGDAPPRDAKGNLIRKADGTLEKYVNTAPALRWVGNGRTIVNNKGNPVKQYQPYFDSTPEYNTEIELTELGHTSLAYYDAVGRVIKTVYPIGTFSTVEFDAWMQKTRDENDHVKASDWYKARIGGGLGADEKDAARKTEVHDETPSITYLDSLGRPFLTMAHHKSQRSGESIEENFYYTRTALDIEGNAKSITDANGHVVMTWKYNMLGNICFQHSMDAGDRWMLADVMGKPLQLWDSRQQVFSYEYDALHRPLAHLVNEGPGNRIFEKFEYGEGVAHDQMLNVKGKLYKHSDTAGLVTNEVFDYKGNLLRSSRRLLEDYKRTPDWKKNPVKTPVLEKEVFASETMYDALNRPVQMTAPDNSIILPAYNEANLLNSVDIKLKGANAITNFVKDINYNEKGQRENILYGNKTLTSYKYQKENLRLTGLSTTANSGTNILQDLQYTYDPVGNITHQADNAHKTIFYGGQKVNAQSNYLYDSLYRLIEAEGREHTGQAGTNAKDNWDDNWSKLILQPNSPVQLRGYTQKYTYDGVGNIEKMQHLPIASPGWTRNYFYGNPNNQLTKTKVGSVTYSYTYNEHGSMKTVPHLLQEIDWNGMEEMQHLHLGGGGEAWYVYDSGGERVRKVIERPGGTSEERIYIGGFEVYRERSGNTVTLERETLHVMDDKQRIAMVETKAGEAPLIRYQYSNHLSSAALELDEEAKIISYEEYHPYGTTAYQATSASKQVPAKRYRYTGMERDEESGLSYHSARYYVPWLGRWLSCDPVGIKAGINVYSYTRNNPISRSDSNGQTDTNKVNSGDTSNPMNYVDFETYALNQPKVLSRKELEDKWDNSFTPELMSRWSYGKSVPPGSVAGHRIQREHPIQVSVRAEQRGRTGKEQRKVSAERGELTILVETGRGYFHTELGKLQADIRKRLQAGTITSERQLIEETRAAYHLAGSKTNTVVNDAELDTVILSNHAVLAETYEQTRKELAESQGQTTATDESADKAFQEIEANFRAAEAAKAGNNEASVAGSLIPVAIVAYLVVAPIAIYLGAEAIEATAEEEAEDFIRQRVGEFVKQRVEDFVEEHGEDIVDEVREELRKRVMR